jgi:hypothetical protein
MWCEGMNWVFLAEDKVWYWAVVNLVKNIQLLQMAGNFLAA